MKEGDKVTWQRAGGQKEDGIVMKVTDMRVRIAIWSRLSEKIYERQVEPARLSPRTRHSVIDEKMGKHNKANIPNEAMRAIKFRSWNRAENRMYENVGINPYAEDYYVFGEHGAILDMYGTAPILMQFTGVKDKHGREICEGDIVTCDHPDIVKGYLWVVKWHEAGFYPFNDIDERTHGELYWSGLRGQLETFEVIGNIHQNPELFLESREQQKSSGE